MHPSAMYGHHPPPGMPLGMHQAVPPHGKTLHAEVNQILLLLYRDCMALVDVLTFSLVVHYVYIYTSSCWFTYSQ